MGFDPASLALAAVIGSAVVGGAGAIQQGQAAKSAADYNAQVAQNNAKIATQNATWAAQEGEANAGEQGAKTKATVAATLASEGASGVDVNSGSFQNVRSSETELGMLDALTIRSNAARTAYGYETQATGDIAQSQLDKAQGQNSELSSYVNAGSTVLGGVGNAASKYTDFLNQGSILNTQSPAPVTFLDG